jgi:DNA polymerase III subunit epsilon
MEAVQASFDELGTPLFTTTFAVLDLETTGLTAARDRITEVGVVKVRGGVVLGEFQTFVHPQRPIPPAITAVTGITDAMVRDAPSMAAVAPTLRGFLGDAVLVAHNAAFDLGFLRAAFERTGLGEFTPVVIDTARLARRLLRDEVHNVRLATVAKHLRSRHVPVHRALADARATVDVLHGLVERAGSLGATTVEDLKALTRSSSDRRFRRLSLVRDAPRTQGVYRFIDARGEVLYIGKATDLRSRLRTYFSSDRRRRTEDLVRETARVTWTPTPTLLEAEVRELREIRRHQPRYNRRSKQAPRPVFVALTDEPFPRLSIVAAPRPAHRAVLGPLPNRRAAEHVVEALQATFRVRACSDRLRVSQDHPACVLKELGRCDAPCDGSISRAGYAEVAAAVEDGFDDPTPVLADLRERMRDLAASGRFERATQERRRWQSVARALAGLRRRLTLLDAGEVVLAAVPSRTGDVEVVVVRHGRLAATLRLEGMVPDEAVLQHVASLPLADADATVGVEHDEEIDLVRAWIDRSNPRLLRCSGRLVEPVAAGQALSVAEAESRRVARSVRRDQQALAGAKVRRRASAPDRHEERNAG